MAKLKLKKGKTQKNIIIIFIVLLAGYISYGFYQATQLKKKNDKWFKTVKLALKDIAKEVGISDAEIETVQIWEIAQKYILAPQSVKDNLLLKNHYKNIIDWYVLGKKDSLLTIDDAIKDHQTYFLNEGSESTIFTKLLY